MFLHNQTQAVRYYQGIPVQVGTPFEISSYVLDVYRNDVDVNTDILNGNLKVSQDGATVIDDPMTGLNTFKKTIVDFEKKDAMGYPAIVTENPSGDFDTLVSHNWCDNTSWPATNDSVWTVEPDVNKIMEIGKSEVQFEHDISISGVTELHIDYYIWHPLYADPIVGKTITIDSARKIFELGNSHYHAEPIGTEIPNGLTTVQFNYRRALTLHYTRKNLGLNKIVFRLEGHVPAGGSYCTVGLVVTESNE